MRHPIIGVQSEDELNKGFSILSHDISVPKGWMIGRRTVVRGSGKEKRRVPKATTFDPDPSECKDPSVLIS